MDSPDISEFNFGLIEEAIVSRVLSTSGVIRCSSVEECSVVVINRGEGITELWESESEISILVISLNEEVKFLGSRENTDFIETILQIGMISETSWINVKNSESVKEVKVGLLDQGSLSTFKFSFIRDLFSKCSYKFIFFT
jgi:hypothetical protein